MTFPNVLLLGASGYLGGCLYSAMQGQARVISTHCTQARISGSLSYDFWCDDLQPFLEQHHIDIVLMAASVAANQEIETGMYQQRVEQFVQASRSCRLVYVSSDGIFDGQQGLYAETDRPTPLTAYGHNLHIFEACVQTHCADYCIARPSYLYGYAGPNLDRRLARVRADLRAGKTVNAFHDMFKSPMQVQ